MDKNTHQNTESTPGELDLFGEIRTIPSQWDVASIMDIPKISSNGRPKAANPTQGPSGDEEGQGSHNEGMSAFDDWYLGPYLDTDDDPDHWHWCAY